MKYNIENVIFDYKQRTISANGRTIELEAKSYELLSAFVKYPQETLSRDTLLKLAWNDSCVSDGAINKAIAKLRNHFELLIPNTTFIETKPKFGYVLCMPVKPYRKTSSDFLRSKKVVILCLAICFLGGFLYLYNSLYKEPSKPDQTIPEVTRFSAYTGIETNLSSANNQAVLLVSRDEKQRRLVLKNAVNKEESILPIDAQFISSPKLSPSGNAISWVYKNKAQCEIIVYQVAHNTQESIYDCSDVSNVNLAWSHDETALFIRSRKTNAHPFVISKLTLNTLHHQQLTLSTEYLNLKGDFLHTVHVNKARLAFVRYINVNKHEVHIINSKNLHTITKIVIDQPIHVLTWGSDEHTLFFASNKKIHRINTQTGTVHFQYSMSYPIESLTALAYGNHLKLLVSQYHASTHLIAYNIHTQQKNTRVQNSALNRLVRPLSNGGVLYISDQDSSHDLWLHAHNKHKKIKLPFEFTFTRYSLSPSEQYITFEKTGLIYEHDLTTNQTTQVLGTEERAYVVNYGRTDNELIYSSNKTGQWQLWLFNKQTGTHQQLTQQGGYSGYFNNDQLYITKREQSGLWLVEDNKEIKLIDSVSNINWLNWTIKNNRIFYFKAHSGIWQFDLTTQKNKLVMKTSTSFLHQYGVTKQADQLIYPELQPMQGDIQALTFTP